jgi:hypothetical protein
MGTISDKLMRIINTKEDIRQALISKGYDVPTSIPFKEYAKMILDLPCRVDSFPDIEGIVARYSALGLTNEQMAENPIWKDLTGNGHDLQMKNFAWKGMSGVGGYTENYDSNKWYKVASRIDATWTYKSFNVKSIKDNNFAQLFYQSQSSDTGFRVLSCTIKVSGLTDGQGIEYISNGTRPTVIMRIENDGIYHLPSFDFGAKNAYYGFRFLKLQESCNITIEQLPLYPGALVFDGVDDYGTCNNFPILTKEKGYTVVALRQWLSFQDIGYPTLVVNSTDRLAAFSFEDFRSKTKSTWNWGRSVGLSDYKIPLLYTYQTSTSYNSKTIYAGATEEGSNILQVCRSGIYCANAAIWEIVILDHDATEEELTKIKDYFVKTYPWLFPDQAWTVTGKTNEDEDRATIANITGNGNDLVLSNFGFAEGSGYGLYKTPFELYPSVQHSSKYSLSFSKFALGDHNLIIAPKQNDLSYDIKVKVTGLKDGVKFKWGWIGTTGYIDITTDGIHMLNKPASQIRQLIVEFAEDFDPDHVVTIEQIPEYEGYLITDGVDDKVTSVNAVTLNKDFTVVGEWRFKETEIRSNCGIVVERVLFVYNIPTGIRIYIHEVGGNFTELQNIKSLKAICSNGIVYDENWNPISVKVGSLEEYSNKLLLGYLSNLFTQIAFKNMSIYSNQVLSKDDCIKAYNYLQTLKSK